MMHNQNTKIVALIVLYKTSVLASKSITTFANQDKVDIDAKLVIWDNSPCPKGSDELAHAREQIGDFEYISTPDNTFLSKVYNLIVERQEFEYLFLLDQDSYIPPNYLRSLLEKTAAYPEIKLFLPLVRNNKSLVSPGSFYTFKGKHWKKEVTGLINVKNVVAITSGMFIAKSYFTTYNYKFDERLSLYAIDTKFMLDFAKNETKLIVLPQTFNHASALWSDPSADELLPRFRNMRTAYAIMLSNRPIACFLTKLHTKYLSLKFAFKYYDFRFLKIK